MTVHLLEEMSSRALDALDRERTMILLVASPLEEHGPHLPVGVDAFAARHFAQRIAERVVSARPGWAAVLAPTLHLGSFTFDAVGTVRVRQRVVRDALVDYGASLARAGFRWILIANGHGGPGHLTALEEAAATPGQKLVRKNGIAKNGERRSAGVSRPSRSPSTMAIASSIKTSTAAVAKAGSARAGCPT